MRSNIWLTGSRGALAGALAVVAVALYGCTGGTDGSGPDFSDTPFVADENTAGKISINIPTTIAVADVQGFSVSVRDKDGQPVANIPVACDTEAGLAIIEPTTGIEHTDAGGGISGRLGCEQPGSFQIGCRLSVGGAKRKFATVKCSGDVPAGFTGFDGAGGGGLFGGVDDGGDSGPGGTDLEGVNVTNINLHDVGATDDDQATFGLDVSAIGEPPGCDGDTTTNDPEPFIQNTFTAFFENNSNRTVRITSFNFSVPEADGASTADYDSSNFNIFVELPANGGTASVNGLLMGFVFTGGTGTGKTFAGRNDSIPDMGVRNITFRFSGETEDGDDVTLTITQSVEFNDFNNCGG